MLASGGIHGKIRSGNDGVCIDGHARLSAGVLHEFELLSSVRCRVCYDTGFLVDIEKKLEMRCRNEMMDRLSQLSTKKYSSCTS